MVECVLIMFLDGTEQRKSVDSKTFSAQLSMCGLQCLVCTGESTLTSHQTRHANTLALELMKILPAVKLPPRCDVFDCFKDWGGSFGEDFGAYTSQDGIASLHKPVSFIPNGNNNTAMPVPYSLCVGKLGKTHPYLKNPQDMYMRPVLKKMLVNPPWQYPWHHRPLYLQLSLASAIPGIPKSSRAPEHHTEIYIHAF